MYDAYACSPIETPSEKKLGKKWQICKIHFLVRDAPWLDFGVIKVSFTNKWQSCIETSLGSLIRPNVRFEASTQGMTAIQHAFDVFLDEKEILLSLTRKQFLSISAPKWRRVSIYSLALSKWISTRKKWIRLQVWEIVKMWVKKPFAAWMRALGAKLKLICEMTMKKTDWMFYDMLIETFGRNKLQMWRNGEVYP